MIENTWAWAQQRGKVYKHPINQAEYCDLDVDKVRERQVSRMSEVQAVAACSVEDTAFCLNCACLLCQTSWSYYNKLGHQTYDMILFPPGFFWIYLECCESRRPGPFHHGWKYW